MSIKNKGINYLRNVREEISNLRFIRSNLDRKFQIENYKALLTDPYVTEYFREVRSLMTVKDVQGGCLVRIGCSDGSGGYVMLDDVKEKDIFYSFGISADVTWDAYPAEKWNKPVYMYDHTISALPYEHSNFKWKKIGICGNNGAGGQNNLKSLSEILRDNGHENETDMILKMDVEGAEWDVFSSFPTDDLDRFDQITLEMHGFLDLNNRDKILTSLQNLKMHHQVVHLHGNCFGISIPMTGYNMPDIMEVTYVRKEGREFGKSNRFFPTSLDVRNDPNYPEIILGYWN